ncbi:MAG TPA: four helix bundle protein [Myxococcota bacterium]|jgi:four helix bundle protein|nr:four helix bundle protein [Myxococcota bacterium]
MHLHAFEVSVALIRELRALVARLQTHDADLASQIRRAASSVPLNVSEGRRRVGRDRAHVWRVAAGSAAEVRAALLVAEAWGYLEASSLREPLALLDRLLAMLWRMVH